jgi:hypothetical protein
MNPRTTYLLGLACLVFAAVLTFRPMFGSRYTPLLIMIVGVVLIAKARLAGRR